MVKSVQKYASLVHYKLSNVQKNRCLKDGKFSDMVETEIAFYLTLLKFNGLALNLIDQLQYFAI